MTATQQNAEILRNMSFAEAKVARFIPAILATIKSRWSK